MGFRSSVRIDRPAAATQKRARGTVVIRREHSQEVVVVAWGQPAVAGRAVLNRVEGLSGRIAVSQRKSTFNAHTHSLVVVGQGRAARSTRLCF